MLDMILLLIDVFSFSFDDMCKFKCFTFAIFISFSFEETFEFFSFTLAECAIISFLLDLCIIFFDVSLLLFVLS